MSERLSDHERQIREADPERDEAFRGRSPDAELLKTLSGFRVEWDDGSVGIAGEMAFFVRTAGFGTGHQRLELLTGDDVVAIFPEERRILVRTRVPPAEAMGRALRHALALQLSRLVRRGGRRRPAGDRTQISTERLEEAAPAARSADVYGCSRSRSGATS